MSTPRRDGGCCERDHMNATPPRSCSCDCHKKPFREAWEKIMNRRRIRFDSEPQAQAFIDGIEFVSGDRVSVEGPEIELDNEGNDEYAVYVEEIEL